MSCLSLRFLQLKIGNDWKKDKNAKSTDVADLGVSELLGVFTYISTLSGGLKGIEDTVLCVPKIPKLLPWKTGPVGQQRKAERENRKGPWTQEGGGYVLLKIVNQIRLIQLQPCWKSQLKTCS